MLKLTDEEVAIRSEHDLLNLHRFQAGVEVRGDKVIVCGRVTYLDLRTNQITFRLADEHREIQCRVPNKRVEGLLARFSPFGVGDFIAVKGWWDGNLFYVRDGSRLLETKPC